MGPLGCEGSCIMSVIQEVFVNDPAITGASPGAKIQFTTRDKVLLYNNCIRGNKT